jgi:hypothetical protein
MAYGTFEKARSPREPCCSPCSWSVLCTGPAAAARMASGPPGVHRSLHANDRLGYDPPRRNAASAAGRGGTLRAAREVAGICRSIDTGVLCLALVPCCCLARGTFLQANPTELARAAAGASQAATKHLSASFERARHRHLEPKDTRSRIKREALKEYQRSLAANLKQEVRLPVHLASF